jgi:hypothetical protein
VLQILLPTALVALAALAVPAILHLWRPPAKRVRIGTLKFFTGPAVRRLNKLRWRERLLLAVRLLLLTLLALFLAQPIWMRQPSARPQKWALFEPGLELHGDAQKRWRELRSGGYQARALAAGFAPGLPNEPKLATAQNVDTWSLLREVDARLPAGSAVAVFSSDRLASLRGARPRLQNCDVEWIHTAATGDRERVWLESIRTGEELRVVIGRSTADTSEYHRLTIPSASGKTALPPPLDGWSLEVRGGKERSLAARVSPNDGDSSAEGWITATPPREVRVALLHEPERAEDARYVNAALHAVIENAGDTLTIGTDIGTAEWIFWLNDQPPPAEVLREVTQRGANLLSDANATAVATATFTTFGDEQFELLRRTPPPADSGAVFWSDGFGVPVLSVARQGAGRHWRFFSRFHPDWNALPRSSALPAALRTILALGAAGQQPAHDLRRADASQAAPGERLQSSPISFKRQAEPVDLRHLLWIFSVGLFVAERVLSHRGARVRREGRVAAPEREPEAVLT